MRFSNHRPQAALLGLLMSFLFSINASSFDNSLSKGKHSSNSSAIGLPHLFFTLLTPSWNSTNETQPSLKPTSNADFEKEMGIANRKWTNVSMQGNAREIHSKNSSSCEAEKNFSCKNNSIEEGRENNNGEEEGFNNTKTLAMPTPTRIPGSHLPLFRLHR